LPQKISADLAVAALRLKAMDVRIGGVSAKFRQMLILWKIRIFRAILV